MVWGDRGRPLGDAEAGEPGRGGSFRAGLRGLVALAVAVPLPSLRASVVGTATMLGRARDEKGPRPVPRPPGAAVTSS